MPKPTPAATTLTFAERRETVTRLLLDEHLSLRQIAARLGVSHETVRTDYKAALELYDQSSSRDASAYRAETIRIMSQRIETLEAKIAQRDTSDAVLFDDKLDNALRKWTVERAKLRGEYPQADAPSGHTTNVYVLSFGDDPGNTSANDPQSQSIIAGYAYATPDDEDDDADIDTERRAG